jgi:hypothetical protein
VRQRELPLAIVRCCTVYVVSMLHAVPQCTHCGLTPFFEHETPWFLGVDED